jgi:hypothetical protein
MHLAKTSNDPFRAIADPTGARSSTGWAGPANAGALAADFRSSRPAISGICAFCASA